MLIVVVYNACFVPARRRRKSGAKKWDRLLQWRACRQARGAVRRDSVRYAYKDTHLNAVYKLITNGSALNFDFKKFLDRKPPKGLMRPFIKSDGKLDPTMSAMKVKSKPPARKRK